MTIPSTDFVQNERFPLKVTVRRIVDEAENIKSFELVASKGHSLPAASPGSHIEVALGAGVYRQYSVYNGGEGEECYRIAVLQDDSGRGGSKAMHALSEGVELSISTPRDRFALMEAPEKYILIAGGIGITPLIPMARELDKRNRDFELHYAVRSLHRAAFASALRKSSFADRVRLYTSGAEVSMDLQELLTDALRASAEVYVCGPQRLIDAVFTTAEVLGLPSEHLHTERFGAEPGGITHSDTEDRGEFDVIVASTGHSFSVPPNRTVAEVLIEGGVDIPLSCEAGICGTCETGILSGIPQHNDQYFTQDEKASNTVFTPCCSRSMSKKLVLDL